MDYDKLDWFDEWAQTSKSNALRKFETMPWPDPVANPTPDPRPTIGCTHAISSWA